MRDAWNPEQYDRFKRERSQPFYDLMALVHQRPGLDIVDLGCGTGELTAEMHEDFQARSTLGIDNSLEMLEKAKAIVAKRMSQISGNGESEGLSSDTLKFEASDIGEWQPKERVDLVLSNAAFQWCKDHPKLFRRVKGFLKPHGQIAIQMPINHDYPTHVLASEMAGEQKWMSKLGTGGEPAHSTLRPEECAKLLFELGFQEQRVFVNVYGHVLDSREDVIEWVKGTLLTHFKGRLQPNDYQMFLAEFRKRLFEKLPDEKPFYYPFKRLFIWARLA